jgi:hypothetical protein
VGEEESGGSDGGNGVGEALAFNVGSGAVNAYERSEGDGRSDREVEA